MESFLLHQPQLRKYATYGLKMLNRPPKIQEMVFLEQDLRDLVCKISKS